MKFWDSPEWEKARTFINTQNSNAVPQRNLIFRPFIETPLDKVKVVMATREPHSGLFNDPDGLAYSCPDKVDKVRDLPDNLLGLFKALKKSKTIKFRDPKHGRLHKWARQGVLLINTSWTGNRASYGTPHIGVWNALTREVIETVYLANPKAMFVFDQGVPIIYKETVPKDARRLIHPTASHPLFVEYGLFDLINAHLAETKQEPIDWNVS